MITLTLKDATMLANFLRGIEDKNPVLVFTKKGLSASVLDRTHTTCVTLQVAGQDAEFYEYLSDKDKVEVTLRGDEVLHLLEIASEGSVWFRVNHEKEMYVELRRPCLTFSRIVGAFENPAFIELENAKFGRPKAWVAIPSAKIVKMALQCIGPVEEDLSTRVFLDVNEERRILDIRTDHQKPRKCQVSVDPQSDSNNTTTAVLNHKLLAQALLFLESDHCVHIKFYDGVVSIVVQGAGISTMIQIAQIIQEDDY
jgi:hypothetical protein